MKYIAATATSLVCLALAAWTATSSFASIQTSTLAKRQQATLSIGRGGSQPGIIYQSGVPAVNGRIATLPIFFEGPDTSGEDQISAFTTCIDYDPLELSFDATDSDGSGLPDAARFFVPGEGVVAQVVYDPVDKNCELAISLTSPEPIPEIQVGEIDFLVAPQTDSSAVIGCGDRGELSFTTMGGTPVPGFCSRGSFAISPSAGCQTSVTLAGGTGAPGTLGNPVPVLVATSADLRSISLAVVESSDLIELATCESLVAGFTCSIGSQGVLFDSAGDEVIPAGPLMPVFQLFYDVAVGAAAGEIPLTIMQAVAIGTDAEPCEVTTAVNPFVVGECSVNEDCTDNIACTIDTCVPGRGCVNEPSAAACDDGVNCTVDQCVVGEGCVLEPDDGACDDGVACTIDQCAAGEGCVQQPNDAACDDGVNCTVDQCVVGEGCVLEPDDGACDDGVACTIDQCALGEGCVQQPNDAACDDGSFCNGAETCLQEVGCQPGEEPDCDDRDICTDDFCSERNEACENVFDLANGTICERVQPGIIYQGGVPAVNGMIATLPIFFERPDLSRDEITAFTTCVDYDPLELSFDPTNSDRAGLPDAVRFFLPIENVVVDVVYDPLREDCELAISLTSPEPIPEIQMGEIDFLVAPQTADASAVVGCGDPSGLSFTTLGGAPVPGFCSPGSFEVSPSAGCQTSVTLAGGLGASGTAGNPVPVLVATSADLRSISFIVLESSEAIQLAGCESLLPGFTCSISPQGVLFDSAGDEVIPAGPRTTVFRLLYDVADGAAEGEVPLSIMQAVAIGTDAQSCDVTTAVNPFVVGECSVNEDCTDNIACTIDMCVPGRGCVNEPNAAACDDGVNCTVDQCVVGQGCVLAPDDRACDDGVACTVDQCAPGEGCVVQPNDAACDDGVNCTVDQCVVGQGCVLAPDDRACDDGVACTVDQCAPGEGCVLQPDNAACDDGVNCTVDQCVVGQGCVLAPDDRACDDGVACTVDQCAPGEGCVLQPDNAACDDGVNCTVDQCVVGEGCVLAPDDRACDDGVACTVDQCAAGEGCVVQPNDAACDDGVNCTVDQCVVGEGCVLAPDDRACDDGVACTVDQCAAGEGCVVQPNDAACDDGVNCTVDQCVVGEGCVLAPDDRACDDGVACTVDQCAAGEGCVVQPNDAACDDGVNCTVDQCVVGQGCVLAPDDRACDDGVACTVDQCAAGEGCVVQPNDAACDDGVNCTVDQCVVGEGCVLAPDDRACDDGVACTVDQCAAGEGCVVQPNDAACDDGVNCTVDQCVVGEGCVLAPDDRACDDGVACTVDQCAPGEGCVLQPDNAACDDGVNCTVDQCVVGQGCVLAPDDRACDDGVACTVDQCAPGEGCVLQPDNAACDDGVNCTVDQCVVGEGCVLAPDDRACDDGVACTVDQCAAGEGCVVQPNDAACDDGVNCTVDQCVVGEGCVLAPDDAACDDGVACTVDQCAAGEGCVVQPNDAACDDGVNCTVDQCVVGEGCVLAPDDRACDDGVACTVDQCAAGEGCVVQPNDAACDDGVNCTVDQCVVGQGCVLAPDDRACDDGVACTVDQCAPGEGCVLQPNDAACDDGVNCTVDQCVAGEGCVLEPDDAACDDGVACTVDQCAPGEGCVLQPDNAACDDGVNCTVDQCVVGQGCVLAPDDRACDDGVACTIDQCAAGEGCVQQPDNAACDDGVNCTVDQCVAGEGCVLEPDDAACDDGVACTVDQCAAGEGCVQQPDNAACDDGVNCTVDQCVVGEGCVLQPDDAACDDGVACTVDQCAAGEGCVQQPDNAACDDGVNCTVDQCVAGEGCVLEPDDAACDDGVACTIDQCALGEGCVQQPDDTACDDGSFCNGTETCLQEVGCQPGEETDCDDRDICTDDFCSERNEACENEFDPANGTICEQGQPGIIYQSGVPAVNGMIATLPIFFERPDLSGEDEIAAFTTCVDYDPLELSFDPTNSDGAGLPDAVRFFIPIENVVVDVVYDPLREDCELAISLTSPEPIPEIQVGEIDFLVAPQTADATAVVGCGDPSGLSFTTLRGAPVQGFCSPGSFEISPSAGCQTSVTLAGGSGAPGTLGNPVPVLVATSAELRSISLIVLESSEAIDLTDCESLLAGFTCSIGPQGVLFDSAGDEVIPAGPRTTVFQLLYDVADGAAAGQVPLTITQAVAIGTDAEPCDVTTAASPFVVEGCSTDEECGDEIDCTVDLCVPGRGCVHEPNDATCDDGVGCTLDSCDPAHGGCVHAAEDRFCDDGSFCNGVETCVAERGCEPGHPPGCDDGDVCTDDTCSERHDACESVFDPDNAGTCQASQPLISISQMQFGFGMTLRPGDPLAILDGGTAVELPFGSFLPWATDLDALDWITPERLHFSVRETVGVTHTGGFLVLRPERVYEFNHATGEIKTVLNWNDWGIALRSLDAYDRLADGSVVFSSRVVQGVYHAGGYLVLRPANLYRFVPDTGVISLYFNGTARGFGTIDAVDVEADGRIALSFEESFLASASNGHVSTQHQNVYRFDPEDESLTLAFDANALGLATLDAYSRIGGSNGPSGASVSDVTEPPVQDGGDRHVGGRSAAPDAF